jgi:hypothetical protein
MQMNDVADGIVLTMKFNWIMFLINDQPNSCGFCGKRTIMIGSFLHTNGKYVVERCRCEPQEVMVFCDESEYSNNSNEAFY